MAFRQKADSSGVEKNESVKNHFKMANLAGTKWHGGGRTGINSILDKEIMREHLETKERNMGKGYLKLQLQGGSDKTAPINIGGRMMYPDAQGNYVIIDGSVVEEMRKSEEEKRTYLEEIIQRASLSNNICGLILGCADDAALEGMLGEGNKGNCDNMSADLASVDCRPEFLECLDPSGVLYSKAIQKLKMILKTNLPMIDNMTPAVTLNQEK